MSVTACFTLSSTRVRLFRTPRNTSGVPLRYFATVIAPGTCCPDDLPAQAASRPSLSRENRSSTRRFKFRGICRPGISCLSPTDGSLANRRQTEMVTGPYPRPTARLVTRRAAVHLNNWSVLTQQEWQLQQSQLVLDALLQMHKAISFPKCTSLWRTWLRQVITHQISRLQSS